MYTPSEYLATVRNGSPIFDWKVDPLSKLPTNIDEPLQIAVWDICKQRDAPVSVSLRCSCATGTQLIQAVRHPPSETCVQLVLWWRVSENLSQDLMDALGLDLKLSYECLTDLLRKKLSGGEMQDALGLDTGRDFRMQIRRRREISGLYITKIFIYQSRHRSRCIRCGRF